MEGGLGTAGDSPPSKDAVRKKTRLRDQLFQDLMKVGALLWLVAEEEGPSMLMLHVALA